MSLDIAAFGCMATQLTHINLRWGQNASLSSRRTQGRTATNLRADGLGARDQIQCKLSSLQGDDMKLKLLADQAGTTK